MTNWFDQLSRNGPVGPSFEVIDDDDYDDDFHFAFVSTFQFIMYKTMTFDDSA
jgi:hypothetical protein